MPGEPPPTDALAALLGRLAGPAARPLPGPAGPRPSPARPAPPADPVPAVPAARSAVTDASDLAAPTEADLVQRRWAAEAMAAARELARRDSEALTLYEPLPEQAKFHASRTRQRAIRGSNRAGKTLAAAVEVARALAGKDPHGKFPDRDGRAYAVGLDLMHVGQVFYRKLFRAGAFWMIRDAATNRWRAYRPWDAADAARRRERRPAPPLVPARLIDGKIAWEDKGKGIPRLIRLKTGWEITFFSSQAKPPQGMDLDLVWFDEEIEDSEWYPEMAARLIDRGGLFVWSATPQAGNEQLLALSERSARDRLEEVPTVEEFVVLMDENPHIPAEDKRAFASLLDDDQLEVRVGGEFAAKKWRVYPEFVPSVHVRPVPDVPAAWTRYMSVDPGRQVCGVLFLAVPPPGTEPFDYVAYDELYLKGCSAAMFASRVAQKARGQEFEAFVIDGRMGRQTELGSGLTVKSQYSKALQAAGVRSRTTGSGFADGLDDVKAGIELCRDWLRAKGGDGCPRLVVRAGTCPAFQDEIKRYRYKRAGKIVTDEPESRGAVHQMANFRYLAGFNPKYRRPQAVARGSSAYQAFAAKRAKRRAESGHVTLGPARSQT
jgi:hypothetical protein